MNAKKWIVAGVTAGVLAGGAAGFALTVPGGAGAATGGAGSTQPAVVVIPQHRDGRGSPEERAAKLGEALQGLVDSGVIDTAERDQVVTALTTRPAAPPAEPPAERPDPATMLSQRLQPLVEDATLTVEQRNAVVASLQAAREARGGEHRGEGRGGEGRSGAGRGERAGRHLGAAAETAASVIGITTDELTAALQGGQSIADIATANGVEPQKVIEALVAEATAELTQRITDMVNGVPHQDGPADTDD